VKSRGQFQVPGFKNKLLYSLQRFKNIKEEERIIRAGKGVYPRGIFLTSNQINNTKFTWYTFIFVFLYQEFSDFSNMYYLMLTVT